MTIPSQEALPVISASPRIWRDAGRDLRRILERRDLLRALVSRELRSRYKGTKLGWVWALIKPLTMLAVYSIALGVFLGANEAIPGYPVYVYTGLIGWGLFSQIVSGSIGTIVASADLIRKTAFPKEFLVAAVVVTAVVDFILQASVLLVGYLVIGDFPSASHLYLVVPAIVIFVSFGAALGMFLAVLNARWRDVGFLTDVALQVGFWVVPVVYTVSLVTEATANFPIALRAYMLNPITIALDNLRLALWPYASDFPRSQFVPGVPPWMVVGGVVLIGLALVMVAHRYFTVRASSIAEVL